ncbi:MAG: hypothetical protein GIKADHBN_01956 [Phycisphaerales bacterium]|nr:hypothetical protein [Phycisphaerales bacterium]
MAMSRTLASFLAALLSVSLAGHAAGQSQVQRITPGGALTSDIFTYDVAYDGELIVAGAPFATYSGVSQPGRAFVFEKPGGAWVQTAELRPPVLQANAAFGTQVACAGGVVVIGTPGEDGSFQNSGAVYVFERLGPIWTLVQRLTAPTEYASGNFGVGVAVRADGGMIVVGSNGATSSDILLAGEVFVFEKAGGVWTRTQTLVSPDPDFDDNFGTQVAIDGDRLIVSAIDDDSEEAPDAGGVYVFERSGGSWGFQSKITGDAFETDTDFGGSLALRGPIAVVGAQLEDEPDESDAGAAYVFRLEGGSWTQVARLTAPVPDASDRFGCDVATDGRTVVVGAHLAAVNSRVGGAFVYRESHGNWIHSATLNASDAGNTNFGWRLAMKGDRAVIGGPFYQTNRGAGYIFESMRSCLADMDGTGFVDTDDYDAFVVAYEAGAAHADMDGSGFVDTDDFDAFVAAYEAGC